MANSILGLLWHLGKGLFKTVWLENWIPSKSIVTSRRDNGSSAPSSKNLRLSIGALTERKDALSIGGMIIKVLDHLVKTFTADRTKEILTTDEKQSEENAFTYI